MSVRVLRKRAQSQQRDQAPVNTSQPLGPRRRRPRSKNASIIAVHHVRRVLRPDMRVQYAEEMAERSVNREAWAELIGQLVERETRGNKSRFAALVGVTYKTVLRWLNQQTDVSEESVRQVARAVGVSPMELMLRVGYYSHADLASADEMAATIDEDPAMKVILDADMPSHVKQRMIERLRRLRERDTERHVDEVQWWIDQASGA